MKNLIKLTLAVAIVVFISAFTLNKTEANNGYGIGDIAEDFSLKNIDGKMVSMSDYKDAKGFIIAFTCNTCPFAVKYEDRIIQLNNKYASKGYPVIAIMPNDPNKKPGNDFAAMKKRAKNKGFTFPYLMDTNQNVFPKFGATKTPHMFVLQKTKKGNVVEYIGAVDDNYKDASAVKTKYVENAVNALLKGDKVKESETKAIGCSIK